MRQTCFIYQNNADKSYYCDCLHDGNLAKYLLGAARIANDESFNPLNRDMYNTTPLDERSFFLNVSD